MENNTVMTLIIRTIQLFEHLRLKLLFQYLNSYTLRSSNRGRRQPLQSYIY